MAGEVAAGVGAAVALIADGTVAATGPITVIMMTTMFTIIIIQPPLNVQRQFAKIISPRKMEERHANLWLVILLIIQDNLVKKHLQQAEHHVAKEIIPPNGRTLLTPLPHKETYVLKDVHLILRKEIPALQIISVIRLIITCVLNYLEIEIIKEYQELMIIQRSELQV